MVPEPVTAVVMVYCFGTTTPVTLMAEDAVKPPSAVVAVIVAEPCARAVTRPVLLTVAIAGALELHVTFLLVALEGVTVAVSCKVSLIPSESAAGLTLTPVTGITTPVVGVLP